MAEYVKRILDVEAPIHEEEVGRRIAELFGKDRAGSRIQDVTVKAFRYLASNDRQYRCDQGFWSTESRDGNPPIRTRSSAPASLQKAAMLPPVEIRAAVIKALEENGAVGREDLAVTIARLFGFQRTGPELKTAIEKEIVWLIGSGRLCEDEHAIRRAK